MPLHRWRREHGGDITAQVDPTDAARWIASAWRGTTCLQTHRRHFRLLVEAQAMADTLVVEHLEHVCGAHCGVWRCRSDQSAV